MNLDIEMLVQDCILFGGYLLLAFGANWSLAIKNSSLSEECDEKNLLLGRFSGDWLTHGITVTHSSGFPPDSPYVFTLLFRRFLRKLQDIICY